MEVLNKMRKNGVDIKNEDIVRICEKYGIKELSVFGSSIRDDFREDSDVDFLVTFMENSKLTLFDIVDLKDDFISILDREVDIVEKEALRNPIRKKIILSTAEVIYAV